MAQLTWGNVLNSELPSVPRAIAGRVAARSLREASTAAPAPCGRQVRCTVAMGRACGTRAYGGADAPLGEGCRVAVQMGAVLRTCGGGDPFPHAPALRAWKSLCESLLPALACLTRASRTALPSRRYAHTYCAGTPLVVAARVCTFCGFEAASFSAATASPSKYEPTTRWRAVTASGFGSVESPAAVSTTASSRRNCTSAALPRGNWRTRAGGRPAACDCTRVSRNSAKLPGAGGRCGRCDADMQPRFYSSRRQRVLLLRMQMRLRKRQLQLLLLVQGASCDARGVNGADELPTRVQQFQFAALACTATTCSQPLQSWRPSAPPTSVLPLVLRDDVAATAATAVATALVRPSSPRYPRTSPTP